MTDTEEKTEAETEDQYTETETEGRVLGLMVQILEIMEPEQIGELLNKIMSDADREHVGQVLVNSLGHEMVTRDMDRSFEKGRAYGVLEITEKIQRIAMSSHDLGFKETAGILHRIAKKGIELAGKIEAGEVAPAMAPNRGPEEKNNGKQ